MQWHAHNTLIKHSQFDSIVQSAMHDIFQCSGVFVFINIHNNKYRRVTSSEKQVLAGPYAKL